MGGLSALVARMDRLGKGGQAAHGTLPSTLILRLDEALAEKRADQGGQAAKMNVAQPLPLDGPSSTGA